MKKSLKISVYLWILAAGLLFVVNGKSDSLIGALDINSRETGDGAGCFFNSAENDVESYVFVDRDGYGWIRINNKIEKFKSIKEFIMWPSKKGDTLDLVYKSDHNQVELSFVVSTGCKEAEDNCTVMYDGILTIYFKGNEYVIKVKGSCGC